MKKIVLLLLAVFLSGCARFVTDKTIVDPSTGKTVVPTTKVVEFTFTFRSTPATSGTYMYYLVISTQNFLAVNPTYPTRKYFFVPGEAKDNQAINDAYYSGDQNKNLTDIYRDYFVSWNMFITYDSTKALRRYSGPFVVSSVNYENDHASYAVKGVLLSNALLAGTTNQLKFRIDLPADSFYFNLYAVDNQSVASKILHDYMSSNKLFNYADNWSQEEVLPEDLSIPAGLDLIGYKARSYQY